MKKNLLRVFFYFNFSTLCFAQITKYCKDPSTNNEFEIVNIKVVCQPAKFSLKQNYPNLFNPTTTIRYSIHEDGNVQLKIYNSIGVPVRTLINKFEASGNYKVDFDA